MTEPGFDQYLAAVDANIKRHGLTLIGVLATDDFDTPMVYTIGMTDKGLPELIITGILISQAGMLAHSAVAIHLASPLTHGATTTVLDHPVRIIDAPAAIVGWASRYYQREHIPTLQVVWSDDEGHFPGEPGWSYPPGRQPLLGPPTW